jgi:hypothetical protein
MVPLDVALVGDPGAPGQVGDLQPPLKQLGDGGVRGRPPALVGLGEQPGTERLGLALGPGRAGEVAALASERVPVGVDNDLPGVAPLADEALCYARGESVDSRLTRASVVAGGKRRVCWW